jgi:hypothetical protein
MDGGLVAVGAVIIGGAFVLFMYLLLGHRIRTWNRRLQHRSEGLPPAGTAIFLDSKGLSVGAEIFAWPQLAIDQIELTQGSLSSDGQTTTIYVLERLALVAGTKGHRPRPGDDAERPAAGRQCLAQAARRLKVPRRHVHHLRRA